jgi:hypothetical protein
MRDSDRFISNHAICSARGRARIPPERKNSVVFQCDEDACCSEMQKSHPLPLSYNAYNIT